MAQANSCAQPRACDGEWIRASYLKFPRWSQPLWTGLTGKPLPRQPAPWGLHPGVALCRDLTLTVLVVALHLWMLSDEDEALAWLALLTTPAFALVTTGLLRKVQVVYAHHAIHGQLFRGKRWLNDRAAALLTLFAWCQNQDEYAKEHLDHHRGAFFSGPHDADAALLVRFGICPGHPLPQLRRRRLITLVSPRFHLWFLWSRTVSNLQRSPGGLWMALLWASILLLGLPAWLGLAPVALAIWLPLVVLYQMSALLQFATEHVWLTGSVPGRDIEAYAKRCHGRFCGEAVPGSDGERPSARVWVRWWCRTLLMHVPTRLAVLVGDLPAHDWHHLAKGIGHSYSAWPRALYERQRAIDSGDLLGLQERELWGIDLMIQHVLHTMAQAPALNPAPAQPRVGGTATERLSP